MKKKDKTADAWQIEYCSFLSPFIQDTTRTKPALKQDNYKEQDVLRGYIYCQAVVQNHIQITISSKIKIPEIYRICQTSVYMTQQAIHNTTCTTNTIPTDLKISKSILTERLTPQAPD